MMVQVTDQLAAFNNSQLDAALRFAEITAESFEKLAEVQFDAVKTALADGVKGSKQLTMMKDPSQLAALGTTLAQPTWEKAQVYAKSVYEVAATAQSGISALLEQQVSEFNKSVAVVLDGVLKNAPAGSEGAISAVKSVIQSASAAYESMLKATKQVAAVAESNAVTISGHAASARRKAA
jgi:phasin family protein